MKQMMKAVCTGLMLVFLTSVSVAGMPPPPGSGESNSSVSIRTHKWQDAENYYLGIILDGIKPEYLDVLARGRSLSLRARHEEYTQTNGGMSMSSGSASVSISLPVDASIDGLKRVITGRDLVIVIPRRQK